MISFFAYIEYVKYNKDDFPLFEIKVTCILKTYNKSCASIEYIKYNKNDFLLFDIKGKIIFKTISVLLTISVIYRYRYTNLTYIDEYL